MRALRSGLSRDDIAARKTFIGGSDAVALASGDAKRILQLWNIKTGRAEPDDLSGQLRVVMGQHTEELNRYWFEKQTNRAVESAGERRTKTGTPWMCCTLDGITRTQGGERAVFEAKHVGPFNYSRQRTLEYYLPQLTHSMSVTGFRWAVLSILISNDRWEFCELELDPFYERTLYEIEEKFWQSVTNDVPPGEIEAPPLAPLPIEYMEVSMIGSNEWGSNAAAYLETLPAVEKNEKAIEILKTLVPPHARVAYGHGVKVSRDKRNALRLGRM